MSSAKKNTKHFNMIFKYLDEKFGKHITKNKVPTYFTNLKKRECYVLQQVRKP